LMDSSDATTLGPSSATAGADGSDEWARRCLGLALILPWWLPTLGNASATFYKELLTLLLTGFAGVLVMIHVRRRETAPALHPLLIASLTLAVVIALQCVLFESVWRKGIAALAGLLVFSVSLRCSLHLRSRFGEDAFVWLAIYLVTAALGSCAFAAVQLIGLDAILPGVVSRGGSSRLAGNVAQANQFADLLWVGAVAAVWLGASRRIHPVAAGCLATVLAFFSVTSGSRTVWLYVLWAIFLGVGSGRRASATSLRRRLGAGLIGLALVQTVLSLSLSSSGLLDKLNITSAEQRQDRDTSESNSQRLWFWRSGLLTAAEHPILGIGAGRLAGAARERLAITASAPAHGADAHAHNLLVQVAAEFGIPAALILATCLIGWLFCAWRAGAIEGAAVAAIAMSGVMLIHANLEHPFGYLYVLAMFGVIAGQVPSREVSLPKIVAALRLPPLAWRVGSFSMTLLAIAAYVSYMPVERATEVLQRQVRAGEPPHPSAELATRLNAVQVWSPYADFAETLGLMASVPTEKTAGALSDRCERAVAFAPTPYFLARCAADLQVAGRVDRAENYVTSLCRAYPESAAVLNQSTAFVATATPSAAALTSTCPVAPAMPAL
jgi:O-antigen ligase